MEIGHNRSGIEWWLMGSRSPRLFPGNLTMAIEDQLTPESLNQAPNSNPIRRSPEFGDSDSFPPGFNQTVARK